MNAKPREQRRLSAGVVVVRLSDHEPRYLLLRAFGYWDFPKGEVETGEEPLQTAVREVEEETGLTDLVFRWGNGYVQTAPYGHHKVARYYVAEALTGSVELRINPELGRPEHHEYRWVDEEQAMALLNDRLRRVLRWAARTLAND